VILRTTADTSQRNVGIVAELPPAHAPCTADDRGDLRGEGVDISERFDGIAARVSSRGLGRLFALRGDDPSARQNLALLLRRDPSLAARLRDGYAHSTLQRPATHPVTLRDVIDFYGFRMIHCQTAANAVSDVVGRAYHSPGTHASWQWMFIWATLSAVLAQKVGRYDDEAFGAVLLRGTALLLLRQEAPAWEHAAAHHALQHGIALWVAERETFGASHLDLARRLVAAWQLPDSFDPACDAEAGEDGLAALLVRALAAAQRFGHRDPDGPPLPARLVRAREPILDAFVVRLGGPQALPDRVRSLMATARVPLPAAESQFRPS
jgi:HDOD domain